LELVLEKGERIISKTDKDGFITYVNQEFLKYSEYKEEELLGANHNIVRHPDMPRVGFRLLWVKTYNSLEVNLFVKNRTKKGNHYWVYATASPIYDQKSGAIKGYISIRKKANEDAVRQIEDVYKKLNEVERAEGGWLASKEVLRGVLSKNGMKFSELMSKMQAQGAILKI